MTQHQQTKRCFSAEFKLEAIEQIAKYQQHAVDVSEAPELKPSQHAVELHGITPVGVALTG